MQLMFASITVYCSLLLCDKYRYPDPVTVSTHEMLECLSPCLYLMHAPTWMLSGRESAATPTQLLCGGTLVSPASKLLQAYLTAFSPGPCLWLHPQPHPPLDCYQQAGGATSPLG